MLIDKYFKNKLFFTLKYKEKSLEKEYRNYMMDLKSIQMRYAPFLTSFFYIWFWIIDFELIDPLYLKEVQYFHLSMVFVLMIPFITSFFNSLKKFMYISLLLAPIYASLGNVYLAQLGMTVYLPDIYLIMVWTFVMAGFYFYEAVLINITMIIITAIFHLYFNILTISYLEVHTVYILIAFVIGAFANYSMEFSSRINFESNKLLKQQQNEIKNSHKQIRDSINYASLIQGALIPLEGVMTPYFKDHFVTWIPKDTVGGDIWLFNELRDKDECLIFIIDCTGHGVPGAFVTMIVKAVEREIISLIRSNKDLEISPATIMGYFNKTMKVLLRQETKDSLSNAGWDGGIIYYNKKRKILKFSGAETSLFYIDKNEDFKIIKGSRYSVGYKKCDADYKYKETIIDVEDGMKFYCTTDGYIDQNGGEKDFPFGKSRFCNIIKKHHAKPMSELHHILKVEMQRYENMVANNDRNDDITVISFEI